MPLVTKQALIPDWLTLWMSRDRMRKQGQDKCKSEDPEIWNNLPQNRNVSNLITFKRKLMDHLSYYQRHQAFKCNVNLCRLMYTVSILFYIILFYNSYYCIVSTRSVLLCAVTIYVKRRTIALNGIKYLHFDCKRWINPENLQPAVEISPRAGRATSSRNALLVPALRRPTDANTAMALSFLAIVFLYLLFCRIVQWSLFDQMSHFQMLLHGVCACVSAII